MTANAPATLPKERLVIHLMLWGAMIATQAIFAGLIVFITPEAAAGADPEVAAMLLPIFGVVALGSAGASLFLGGLIASRGDYQVYNLLRWALAESVGVTGMVLAFLGAPIPQALIFVAVAALVILSEKPGPKSYERYLRERGAARPR